MSDNNIQLSVEDKLTIFHTLCDDGQSKLANNLLDDIEKDIKTEYVHSQKTETVSSGFH
ncbi:hypothetical protein I4U23_025083 [Adineta vaga]|nr:hypothetical protein I4U23_025083 [Adineta vaga]